MLFRRYGRNVARFVLARTGDAELAETITSRVFSTVVHKFEQCKENQAGWLWSIVRSELAMYFRQQKKHEVISDQQVDPTTTNNSPQQQLEQAETAKQLHNALAKLDDEQQMLIYMKFFQNLPNVEIAAATKFTASNVGIKIHRTVKQLRGLMDGWEEGNAKVQSRKDAKK